MALTASLRLAILAGQPCDHLVQRQTPVSLASLDLGNGQVFRASVCTLAPDQLHQQVLAFA
jgi:hypothetical protein